MLWCVRDDDNVCMQMNDGGDEQTQYLCDIPVRDGEEVHTLIMQFIRLGVELFYNNRFAQLLQYGKATAVAILHAKVAQLRKLCETKKTVQWCDLIIHLGDGKRKCQCTISIINNNIFL